MSGNTRELNQSTSPTRRGGGWNNNEEDIPQSSSPKIVDYEELHAAALNELSLSERQTAIHDVHGVSDLPTENQSWMSEKLRNVDSALEEIKTKLAYDMARALSSEDDVANDDGFRLKFLRAENYDASKAAERIVRYFEWKNEVFGGEKLPSEITITDFDESELDHLKSGFVQLLPLRDRSGRAVLFMSMALIDRDVTLLTKKKIVWYISMKALEDEVTQCNGVVLVFLAISSKEQPNQQPYRKTDIVVLTRQITHVLPLRLTAIHICYDDLLLRPLLTLAAYEVKTMTQARVKYHFGTLIEVESALMKFGVSKVILPIDDDGIVSSQNHQAWVEDLIWDKKMVSKKANPVADETESMEDGHHNFSTGKLDVLMGARSKAIDENPGNVRLRRLIESNLERYNNANSNFNKTVVSQSLVATIKEYGGRFLKQDKRELGSGWVEVDGITARTRVAHAFRNQRRRSVISLSQTKRANGPPASWL